MPGMTRVTHTEESAEVEVLLANMEKLSGLTKKIHTSLGRLETSGRSVQDAIRPIYGNTSKLQITNSNIDKINKAIENIRQPLERRRKEEDVLRAGLSRVELSDYLASMDRTQQVLNRLQQTNMRSNQEATKELVYLLKFGSNELESEFSSTLREESSPVEPLMFITKALPFPNLSERNSSKLRAINSYVSSSSSQRRSDAVDLNTASAYAEIRGRYLSSTLENLASASVNTAVRKADPHAIYRPGTSGIGTYSTALEQLFASEYDNICPIFGRDQWVRVHSMTCYNAMQQLVDVLKSLHQHIKSNILTDCFLAFEVVELISSLSFRLESKNADMRQPVQDALRPIRETAKYSLTRLMEDTKVRVQSIMTLPSDASAAAISNETMTRLQAMTACLNPLASMLASVGEGGWRGSAQVSGTSSPRNLDVGLNGQELFASYVADMVETLLNGLMDKARAMLKTKSAQGVFVANNVAVVDRAINTSDLQNLLNDATRQKMERWRKRAYDMYTEPWLKVGGLLHDVQYTNRGSNPGHGRPPSNSLSGGIDSAAFVKNLPSKEKDGIKSKFKDFNDRFEELMSTHRVLRADSDIRERMIRDISATVEPLYDRFWDRYHDIDKGKGKYVKYDKQQLRSVLQTLG